MNIALPLISNYPSVLRGFLTAIPGVCEIGGVCLRGRCKLKRHHGEGGIGGSHVYQLQYPHTYFLYSRQVCTQTLPDSGRRLSLRGGDYSNTTLGFHGELLSSDCSRRVGEFRAVWRRASVADQRVLADIGREMRRYGYSPFKYLTQSEQRRSVFDDWNLMKR